MPGGKDSGRIVVPLLKKSGVTFGFESAVRRRIAWPLVLECGATSEGILEPCSPKKVDRQIVLDVDRSFHFDVCQRWSASERKHHQLQLSAVLHRVFSQFEHGVGRLHYYQGANDVASVCLLQCGSVTATRVLQKLYAGPLRGYTESTMSFPMLLVDVMSAILLACEPELAAKLKKMDIPMHFAFAWVLTWFAHNLESLENVARVFDFFICSPPILAAYVAVALVCCHKESILETEEDYGEVYMLLQSLPTKLDMEPLATESSVTLSHLLIVAQAIFETHPLVSLALPTSTIATTLEYWPELRAVCKPPSRVLSPTSVTAVVAAGVALLAIVVGVIFLWPNGKLSELLAVVPTVPDAVFRTVKPFWKSAWWLAPGT